MANPCSPNDSEPKPDIGSTLVFDAAKLAQFLLSEGMGWLSPLVPQIGGKSYDLATFCAADPPDAPTTDATTIAGFFSPLNPTGTIDLQNWLVQVADYHIWYASCQCSAGSQPTPPDPIDQPTDVNFQPPSTSSSDHCFQGTGSNRAVNYANHFAWNFNDLLPANSGFSDGEFTIPGVPTPLPASIVLDIANGNQPSLTYSVQVILNQYNAAHSSISASSYTSPVIAAGGSFTTPALPIASNCAYWAIIAVPQGGNSGAPTNLLSITATVYCQGQGPNSLGMVCCPTDPNLLAMIQEVLDRLTFIETIIPARAPTYAERSTTTGLSDTGNFTVADDVIAVKIALTTIPAYIGKLDGLPITYFGVGWVTPTTDSGPQAGIPISRATQVFPLPEATTGLDYALSPGVVISITELLAG